MEFKMNEEQEMIRDEARKFALKEIEPAAAEVDRGAEMPPDIMEKMARAGFLGMLAPREYGGSETGHLSQILACEQLGYAGSEIFYVMLMNNATAEAISTFGTEEQGKKYVRPICEGAYASTAFTEEATGSDPEAITTTGLPKDGYYVLNGLKRFITSGRQNGPILIYAKDETGKITGFIAEKNCQGYTTSKPWPLMALSGLTVDVYLDGVKVPKENILGEKGKGFDYIRKQIEMEKMTQAAGAVGLGQAALDESIRYSAERIVRGKPLASMQGYQWMLAEMASKVEACRWMTYAVAWSREKGEDVRTKASMLKVFVMPTIMEVVGLGVRIHGAYGYSKEFKIERLFRVAKANEIVATSLEISKAIVAASLKAV
jgi:alkylation response protein AidB-like acyl-CoA dehydrogenase